jgi:hypothetical protein
LTMSKNPQKPSADVNQPGVTDETLVEGEATRSAPPALSSDARTGNVLPGVSIAEGPVEPGGGEAANDAGAATAEDAETRSRRAFFGRSGHLAVMSEFLHRRINVAIPEVDVGDDFFVIKGTDDTVTRVQVKAATAKAQAGGYFARFNVPLAQLSVPRDTPALVYVFAIRFQERWSDFVVIRRSTLFARFSEGAGYRGVSDKRKEFVQFRIVFTETTAKCGPVDLHRYRDAWDPWPPPQLEDEDTPAQAQVDTGIPVPSDNLLSCEDPGGQPQPPRSPNPATP